MQVLTRSYDNARTGANTQEVLLKPGNVDKLKFLRSLQLRPEDDKRIEAQPLYVANLKSGTGNVHRGVAFICTMANNVYAFDVDNGSLVWGPLNLGPGKPIQPASKGKKADPLQPQDSTEIDLYGINDRWGILSTPVIDPDTNIMYAVNWSSEDGKRHKAQHVLHAVDLLTGQDLRSLPIHATAPITDAVLDHSPTPAPGALETTSAVVPTRLKANQIGAVAAPASFVSPNQKQRSALLLTKVQGKKTLFVASGKFGEDTKVNVGAPSDPGHFTHGWVIAFDVESFRQTAEWCPTPTTGGGGIWQAGQGPASDDQGNVFCMTSNGGYIKFVKTVTGHGGNVTTTIDHTVDHNGTTDFAESFVRLRYTPPADGHLAGKLNLDDWFIPFKDLARSEGIPVAGNRYDFQDQDLGSAGPVLSTFGNLVLGAGKDGVLYVFDQKRLGKIAVDPGKPDLANYPSLKSAEFVTYFPGPDVQPLGNLDFFRDGKTHHLHGSPVLWNSGNAGPLLFVHGENAPLRAWNLQPDGSIKFRGQGTDVASAFSAHFDAMPGGILSLSANSTQDGVVWVTVPIKGPHDEGDANKEVVEGVLRAYDAANLDPTDNADGTKRLKLLWDSRQQIPDHHFTFNKFCPPVVADGNVIVATYNGRVDIYGLAP